MVSEYAEEMGLALLARYALCRAFANLLRNSGAEIDQIKASLGYAIVQTAEQCVGETQRFTNAPDNRLGFRLKGESKLRSEFSPEEFAEHPLRMGLATPAAVAGVSERKIMDQTGHRSEAMVRRYIRDGNLFRDNAASKVGL